MLASNRGTARPRVLHREDDHGVLAFHCGDDLVVAD